MVDATSRSQLIQDQIRQLQQNAPPPLTDAERNQIMKGRKSQKDIDAGRAAIVERESAIRNHQNAIAPLFEQLRTAQNEERAAATAAEREKGADPWKQTYYPGAAGAAAGFGVGEVANRIVGAADKSRARALLEIGEELGPTGDLTNSQLNRSRAMGAAAAAEKVAPTGGMAKLGGTLGRAATYGIPSAVVLREWNRYQQLANDESVPFSERQSYQQMANFFLGTGTGIAAEGGMRFGNKVMPEGAGKALARVHTARDLAQRFDQRDAGRGAPALEPQPAATPVMQPQPSRPIAGQTIDAEALPVEPRPQLPPPVAPPAEEPAGAATPPPEQTPIPNRDRLRNAASAAKGGPVSSRLKKEAHYNLMKKSLTPENLPDVAEALNMPRDSTRAGVLQRARELKGMGGKSGLFLPFAAGAMAYGLAGSNKVRAADGSEIGPSTADRLTSAGVAAGTSYGAGRVLGALDVAGKAAGGMMEPIASMGVDPLEGGSREETGQKIAEARGQASYNAPWLAEHALGIPRSEGTGYDISRNPPSPNPLRTEASPGNQYFPLSSGQMGQPGAAPAQPAAASAPQGADPDVSRAWAKSPRATVIELTRSSGLDPEDIAHLAGITPDEVHSVLQGIPQQALAGR